MSEAPRRSGTDDFERLLARPVGPEKYLLRLYVTGMTPRSTLAIDAN